MSQSLLTRLWSHARDTLNRFRASLLPLDTLNRRELADLRRWLAALEAFVRRTVLLEALSMDPSDRGPSGSRAVRGPTRPSAPRKSRPRLRLWPAPKRVPVRITLLGPPSSMRELWRNQRRDALVARLRAARWRRRAPHIRIADRIDALENLLAAPIRAARRLARRLKNNRPLALKLAFTPVRDARWLDGTLQHEGHGAVVDLALNSS